MKIKKVKIFKISDIVHKKAITLLNDKGISQSINLPLNNDARNTLKFIFEQFFDTKNNCGKGDGYLDDEEQIMASVHFSEYIKDGKITQKEVDEIKLHFFPTDTLIKELKKTERRVWALQQLGSGEKTCRVTQHVRAMLKNDNPEIRKQAAQTLANLGNKAVSAAGDLIDILSNPKEKENVRSMAAYALGRITARIKTPKALVKKIIAVLKEYLKDKKPDVRVFCAHGLGDIGKRADSAVDDLAYMLANDKDDEARRCAAYALCGIGAKSSTAIHYLKIKTIKDDYKDVRFWSVCALYEIAPEREDVITVFISKLHGKYEEIDPNVLSMVILGLSKSGEKAQRAVPYITKRLLLNEPAIVRYAAVRALGDIGDVSAIPIIEQFLRNEQAYVKKDKMMCKWMESALTKLKKIRDGKT